MRSGKTLLLALVGILSLWVSPLRAETLVFGVLVSSEVRDTFLRFRPLALFLEQDLGRKVRLQPLPWPKFEQAFRQGRFHLALASPGCFLLRAPYRGVLWMEDPRTPVIIFRRGTLRSNFSGGKAAVWPYSYEGYLAQAAYLSSRLGAFPPKGVRFLGAEPLVVFAVLNGKEKLGMVSLRAARPYASKLKIIRLEGKVRWVVFFHRRLSPSLASRIKSVLLSYRSREFFFAPLASPPDLSSFRRFVP